MEKSKRTKALSIVLIVSLLVTLFVGPARATEDTTNSFTVTVGSDTDAKPGDTVELPITISDVVGGYTALGFAIEYDSDVLTLAKSVAALPEYDGTGDIFMESENIDDNPYNLIWTQIEGVDADPTAPIATLTFTVNADAKLGDTTVAIKASPTAGGSMNGKDEVAVTYVPGTVTVASACEHTNTTTTEDVTLEATCTEAGSKTVTVTCECGEVISITTVEIPATGEHNYVDGACDMCGAADPDAVKTVAVTQMMNGSTVAAEFEYETLEEALAVAYDLASTKFGGDYCDPVITLNKDVALTSDVEVPAYTTVKLGDYKVTVGDYAFEITGSGKVTANYAIDLLKSNPLVKEAVSGGVYTYTAKIQLELNSKSLTLSDQIFINFNSNKKVSDYSGTVEYGFDYYWSEKPAEVMTVNSADLTTNSSSKVSARTMGIPAKDMSNAIVGRFWAKTTVNGVECYAYSNTVEYSIVHYASSKLGGSDAKLNNLLKNMLNYGTYFQVYKSYRLNDLANDILDEADKVLPTAAELKSSDAWISAAAVPTLEDYSPASVFVKSQGLELLDVINIKYNLNKAPASGVEHVLCVWTKAEYEALTKDCKTDEEISAVLTTENCNNVLTKSADGNFFVVEGIAAKKYADTIVTRSMYVDANGKLQLDWLASYSPITYCTKNIDDSATGDNAKLSDTCKALMLYSAAARSYFNYTVDAG